MMLDDITKRLKFASPCPDSLMMQARQEILTARTENKRLMAAINKEWEPGCPCATCAIASVSGSLGRD